MSAHRRRPSPQHDVVSSGRTDEPGRPFPNKPVSHRRPLKPRTQDPPDLCDFEKLTFTEQPRDAGNHQADRIETTGTRPPKRDIHRLPSGEVKMAKAIEAQELMLQEKLWRVEEKVRQAMQRENVDTVAKGQRVKNQTATRLLEQHRREAEGNRGTVLQEREQEDIKHHRVRQEEESRCAQVKEHTRRKGEYKRDGVWTETHVKSQDRREEVEEAEQRTTYIGDKDWTGEKQCRERTRRKTYDLDEEGKMAHISQEETSQRSAQDARRNQCEGTETPLPSCSPQSSRPDQEELRLTNADLKLLPCRVCNRKFASERIEKHMQICKKVKQSHRPVYNSFSKRVKGSELGEYLRIHGRSNTPEVLKKKKPSKTEAQNKHKKPA